MVLVGDVDDLDEPVLVRAVDPEAPDLDARVRGGRSVVVACRSFVGRRGGGTPLAGRPAVPPSAYTAAAAGSGSDCSVRGASRNSTLRAITSSFWRLAAVLGLPLGVVQVSLDGDPAALGEVLRAGLGLAAEDGHVDEVRAAVLTVLAALALYRQAQPSDLGAAPLVESGFGGEAGDDLYYLELGVGVLGGFMSEAPWRSR